MKKSFFARPAATPRTRVLMALTCAVVLLGYGRLFYLPQAKIIRETRNANEALASQMQSKRLAIAAFRRAPSANGVDQKINRYLDSHTSMADLLKILNQDHLPMTLNRIDVEKHELFPEFSRTQLNVELEGSFVTLGQFLDRLEQSDFLLQIQSVEISHIGRDIKKCTGKFKLFVYLARNDL